MTFDPKGIGKKNIPNRSFRLMIEVEMDKEGRTVAQLLAKPGVGGTVTVAETIMALEKVHDGIIKWAKTPEKPVS